MWTKEPPTEAGYYWMRERLAQEFDVSVVYCHAQSTGDLEVFTFGQVDGIGFPADHYSDAEWWPERLTPPQ